MAKYANRHDWPFNLHLIHQFVKLYHQSPVHLFCFKILMYIAFHLQKVGLRDYPHFYLFLQIFMPRGCLPDTKLPPWWPASPKYWLRSIILWIDSISNISRSNISSWLAKNRVQTKAIMVYIPVFPGLTTVDK